LSPSYFVAADECFFWGWFHPTAEDTFILSPAARCVNNTDAMPQISGTAHSAEA
jgi:hypothetical protein